MTRRIVAPLGATRIPNTGNTRAFALVKVVCGALRAHWPIAAYERAPATTADTAITSTLHSE